MKFSIARETLAEHLDYITKFTAKRNTLPILANVRITAHKSSLELAASNLSVSSKVGGIKASIAQEGETTVNAEKLYNLVKLLPDTEIDFNATANDRMSIKVGGSISYTLATLPSDDFPNIISHGTETSEIPAELFVDMLKDTLAVQSKENMKEFLRCAHVTIDKSSIEVVATDGRRMTRRTETIDPTRPIDAFMLPEEACKLVIHTFADAETLKLSVSNNNVVVSGTPSGVNEVTISARMLDGSYPDYNHIIDGTSDNKIEVITDTKVLISSLRRVALLSPTNVQKITMSASADMLKLSAETSDSGTALETIDCSTDGEIEICANARYIIDALSTIKTDTVVLAFKADNNPIRITPNGAVNHVWVVMPIRK